VRCVEATQPTRDGACAPRTRKSIKPATATACKTRSVAALALITADRRCLSRGPSRVSGCRTPARCRPAPFACQTAPSARLRSQSRGQTFPPIRHPGQVSGVRPHPSSVPAQLPRRRRQLSCQQSQVSCRQEQATRSPTPPIGRLVPPNGVTDTPTPCKTPFLPRKARPRQTIEACCLELGAWDLEAYRAAVLPPLSDRPSIRRR
jgi:hypothetical protein